MTVVRAVLVTALFAAPIFSSAVDGGQDAPGYKESDFLTRVRRLTVEGKRAGEGYWSPDGKRLVFQSEREPGNPFYQIYVLDLVSGETRRISRSAGTRGTTTPRWTSTATARNRAG
jgi:Tol biopolymer transport system component